MNREDGRAITSAALCEKNFPEYPITRGKQYSEVGYESRFQNSAINYAKLKKKKKKKKQTINLAYCVRTTPTTQNTKRWSSSTIGVPEEASYYHLTVFYKIDFDNSSFLI